MSAIRWQSAVDFFVLALGIYLLLKWSREARSLRLALGILALRVGAIMARQLGLLVTGWVFDAATIVVILALVVVFQPELRRALMRLDLPGQAIRKDQGSVTTAVSEAVWSLARSRCGALVAITGRDALDELVTGGLKLDGHVSAPILETIFQKSSAVHDGAAIIEAETLSRVGVILPLTQRTKVPERFGTRHRAAMGLAERSDALVLVVSEERGEVTLMRGDRVWSVPDESGLVEALSGMATRPESGTSSFLPALRPTDFKLPATALSLSAMVWCVTFLFPGASVRARSVPLDFTHVPPGLTIASQSVDTVEVWLRGSEFVFDSVDLEAMVAHCDLVAAHEGPTTVQVAAAAFDLPPGLRVEGIAPRHVIVNLTHTAPPPKVR